ncbi:hypothetical protein ACLOJK_040160 [Asimina triloba]
MANCELLAALVGTTGVSFHKDMAHGMSKNLPTQSKATGRHRSMNFCSVYRPLNAAVRARPSGSISAALTRLMFWVCSSGTGRGGIWDFKTHGKKDIYIIDDDDDDEEKMEAMRFVFSLEFLRMAVLWTLSLIFSYFHLSFAAVFRKPKSYPRLPLQPSSQPPICIVTGTCDSRRGSDYRTNITVMVRKWQAVLGNLHENQLLVAAWIATSGLGAAAAKYLSKAGYYVILAGRSSHLLSKANEFLFVSPSYWKQTIQEIKQQQNNAHLKAFEVDLSSFQCITKFRSSVEQWLSENNLHPSVQLLINNAGILATSCRFTEEGYDQMMGTNYIGAFTLTNLLLPLLKNSSMPSRIVNMQLDEKTVSGKHLKHLSRPTAADPGVVKTAIMREVPWNVSQIAFSVLRFLKLLQSPEKGIDSIIDAAFAPQEASGQYFFGGKGRTMKSSPLSYDAELAKKLWATSSELLFHRVFDEAQTRFMGLLTRRSERRSSLPRLWDSSPWLLSLHPILAACERLWPRRQQELLEHCCTDSLMGFLPSNAIASFLFGELVSWMGISLLQCHLNCNLDITLGGYGHTLLPVWEGVLARLPPERYVLCHGIFGKPIVSVYLGPLFSRFPISGIWIIRLLITWTTSDEVPMWDAYLHEQGAQDLKKVKRYSKIGKEVVSAVKKGGPNPISNVALAAVLEKAKELDVPKEILERNIKRASEKGQDAYIEKFYEVYGFGGVGMVVEVLTDKVNRSVAAVREVVKDYGGKMADPGSILFKFRRARVVNIKVTDADKDQLLAIALDAGAEDVIEPLDDEDDPEDNSERYYKIVSSTENYSGILDKLREGGIAFEPDNGFELLPLSPIEVDDEAMDLNKELMSKLLELDDVDAVYTDQK